MRIAHFCKIANGIQLLAIESPLIEIESYAFFNPKFRDTKAAQQVPANPHTPPLTSAACARRLHAKAGVIHAITQSMKY